MMVMLYNCPHGLILQSLKQIKPEVVLQDGDRRTPLKISDLFPQPTLKNKRKNITRIFILFPKAVLMLMSEGKHAYCCFISPAELQFNRANY